MKKLLYITSLLLLILSSCNRRPLNEETGKIAMVPIKIDWTKSNLKIEEISRVTVRIFPHDGSPAHNFVMQESIYEDVMPLAVGKYSLVVFNETTDPNDWKSLVFKNEDQYEMFIATTADDTFKGLYTKADGDVIRKSPDRLAVWSLAEFEVTPEMVTYTRALSKGQNTKAALTAASITKVEQQMTKLTSVAPLTVVKSFNIIARVQNLVSAKKSSGAIRGAAGAIQMATQKPIEAPITHLFIMNGRQYDNPQTPKDGTLGASITIFDFANLENLKCELLLDFQLYDDTMTPTELFDITADMKTDQAEINVAVGQQIEGRPGDRPIILPAFPVGGQSVGVDEWNEVLVPIK